MPVKAGLRMLKNNLSRPFGRGKPTSPAPKTEKEVIPTNELIVTEWMKNKTRNNDVIVLKFLEFAPEAASKKKKRRKLKKKAKHMKMITCPHMAFNLYLPEGLAHRLMSDHDKKYKSELTKLMLYHKRDINNMTFIGSVTCNTNPLTPASNLDNGVFIVKDNTKTGKDTYSVVTLGEKELVRIMGTPPPWNPSTYNTALTFYELRWFMDHPFYITMVLTVIADHTLLVPKSEKNTRGDQQPKPKKKPKPSSFLKEDYSQHLQEMVELLAKQLVFMSRRPRQQGDHRKEDSDSDEEEEISKMHKISVSAKNQVYDPQVPFTLEPIQTSLFQPKTPKKLKSNPQFGKNRRVYVTRMPLKINEQKLEVRRQSLEIKTLHEQMQQQQQQTVSPVAQ